MVVKSFSNKADGVTALVYFNGDSYSVTLRDDDSGLNVPIHHIKIATLDAAEGIAKKLAAIED